MDGNGMI